MVGGDRRVNGSLDDLALVAESDVTPLDSKRHDGDASN
jgi:hypothetical protein